MKKSTLFWFIFLILTNLIILGLQYSEAQDVLKYDVLTGGILPANKHVDVTNLTADPQEDILCREFHFWTISGNGEIIEWEYTPTAINFIDTIFPSSPMLSLAYVDNVNSGTSVRTFYGSNLNSGRDVYYFNGQNWDTLFFPSGPAVPNSGGFHSYLYFQCLIHGGLCDGILRFDGTNYDTIYAMPPNRNFTIADIAVDAQGNIWSLDGSSPTQSDSVIVISPGGNVLAHFALSLNTLHAYGCFLLNNEFYIVFGSVNPTYPSSVVQIGFSGSQAFVQTVTPFPNNDNMDVASCVPGIPQIILSNPEDPELNSEITISPNPTTDFVRIKIPEAAFNKASVCVFDYSGKLILHRTLKNRSEQMDLTKLANGLYYLIVDSNNKRVMKKIEKIY